MSLKIKIYSDSDLTDAEIYGLYGDCINIGPDNDIIRLEIKTPNKIWKFPLVRPFVDSRNVENNLPFPMLS